MIITIVLFFIWSGYAILEGWREAHYFHFRIKVDSEVSKKEGRLLHGLWSLQRFFVCLLMLIITYKIWWLTLIFLIANMSVFPFLHDGMYYKTRHKLDTSNYPKGWLDWSHNSTAFWTKYEAPIFRILLFVIGIFLYVLYFDLSWILK